MPAALRLAKLIQSIRTKQAKVPITIVCHSQGNMVGLAAAFFGDALPEVTDPWGNVGRCVADAYVLANPRYSVANTDTGLENWSQRSARDVSKRRRRETYKARTETLRNFLDIIRDRTAFEMLADKVDEDMANARRSQTGGKPYSAEADRTSHGLNGHTYGRVTPYCCPHDQVISAATVQGIGWRGLGHVVDEAYPWLSEEAQKRQSELTVRPTRLVMVTNKQAVATHRTGPPPFDHRNTTVFVPFSTMRCSTCHFTARASVTHSTSRPIAVN